MKTHIEWLNHQAQTYLVAANFEGADKKEPCRSGLTLVAERYAAIAAELASLMTERDETLQKLDYALIKTTELIAKRDALKKRVDLAESTLERAGWKCIPNAIHGAVWKPPVNTVAANLRRERDQLKDELENVKAERGKLAAELMMIKPVLRKSAETFEHYAQLHAAKGPGHEEKVARNTELAKMLRRKLDALKKALAESCQDERSQILEACPGGGCERALAAELERDSLASRLSEIEKTEPVCWKVFWPDGEEVGFVSTREEAEFNEHQRDIVVRPLYDRPAAPAKREFSVKE